MILKIGPLLQPQNQGNSILFEIYINFENLAHSNNFQPSCRVSQFFIIDFVIKTNVIKFLGLTNFKNSEIRPTLEPIFLVFWRRFWCRRVVETTTNDQMTVMDCSAMTTTIRLEQVLNRSVFYKPARAQQPLKPSRQYVVLQ